MKRRKFESKSSFFEQKSFEKELLIGKSFVLKGITLGENFEEKTPRDTSKLVFGLTFRPLSQVVHRPGVEKSFL